MTRRAPSRKRGVNHADKPKITVPPLENDAVRVIPLGGVEEVGRNMTIVETKDDILIIDMGGLHFD